MANYGYMAKIGADTSGLQSALKDINSSLKSTDSELYKVNKSIKTAEQAGTDRADILRQKEDILGDAISGTAEKLEKLRSIEEQMKNAADNNSISAEQYRDYQRELANTEAQLRQYQIQLAQTQQEQAGLNASNQAVVTGLGDVQSAYRNVVNDIKFFTDALSDAAKKAVSFSETAVKASLSMGGAFESSMSKVQAYSGAVGEDFEKLEQAAKEAGATTSKSASESADALGYMALAGWDTEEMLDGLMPILRASEAGTADLGHTSDLVTDSMSAMGIATDDLTHYLDVCTAAQSNSNTTLTGLLEAYTGCGGTLRNLNVPLEESAALLGVLANRGIKASEAGTSLNSILVNLIGANKNAKGAMDELGVSAWDEEGKFIGLSETLKLLKTALADCTDEQKAFFEAKIGGKTQMDTLQALINGIGEEYDDLYDTLMNANGALETTAKTMQDNFAGAVTTMKSALEALGIEFYDYLEEPAKEAVNAVTEALRTLTESVDNGKLGEALENLSGKIADLIEKLAEFASEKGIELVIDGLSEFIDLLSWLTDNLDSVTALVKGLGAAFLTIKVGQLAVDVMTLVGTISALAAAAEAGSVAAAVLGTALNAIPFVAVGALAIGAATAFASFIDAAGDAKASLENLHTETDDFIERMTEEISKLGDVSDEFDKNSEKIDENCDKAKDLWEQLRDLCDEEGNVNGAYKEAQSLIDQLNVLTDSHITLIGDQIQGYDDLCNSMDNYIERMRISAKLEYMHEDYVKAIGRRDELQEDINTAKSERDKWVNKKIDFNAGRAKGQIKAVSDFTDVSELYNSPDWQYFMLWFKARYGRNPSTENIDDYAEFLDWQLNFNKNQAVVEAEGAYKENQNIIDKYETESANLTQIDKKTTSGGVKTPAQLAAEESAKNNKNKTKENAEKQADEDREKMAGVLTQLNDLDNNRSLTDMSEEDYYAQLENITEENKSLFSKYTDSDEWKKFKQYLDKVKSYKDKQNKSAGSGKTGKKTGGSASDNPESIASSAISSKKIELENKKAKSDNYTDADYYNDLEAWAEKEIDHSTEAYTKLQTEIANGRKKLLENAEAEEKKAAEAGAKETVADIKSKAEEASGYDTSSLEYFEDLEKRFNAAGWTELEKGTDTYNNAKSEIENGKKKAKYKADLTAAKKAVDDLVTKYENGDEEINTAEILKENVDAVVSEWKDKNIDISEYAAEKLAKAKAPAKSAREKQYEEDMSDIDRRAALNEEGYRTEDEIRAKKTAKNEEYRDISGTSTTWWKNQKDIAEGEFDDLYQQYSDGLIDYEKFITDYIALKEKWAKDNIDISEDARSELEKSGEKELSDLKKRFDDEEITYEQYCKGVQDITDKYGTAGITLDPSGDTEKASDTETKKGTDAYDEIADGYENGLISEEEYQRKKLDLIEEYGKKGIDITQHIADRESEITAKKAEEIQKKYDDLNARIDARASQIASGPLYEEKEVSGGGKRKIFTDLNKKTNDIKKYTEDLKKLRETGIPQELMDRILAMDFDERREVIKELLKMSESKRNLYYTDYRNWYAEAQKAAELEYSDEKADIEKEIADSTDNALESTVKAAGNYGLEAAKAYIDSWNKAIQSMNISLLNPQAQAAGNNGTGGSSAGNSSAGGSPANDFPASGKGDTYISARQPISINIAGTQVIQTTVGEMLRRSGLTGRANSRL